MSQNPFIGTTDTPYVAILGKRKGYIQLATSQEVTSYQDLPDELLLVAKAWASELEQLGTKRIYWITLSEVVTHLHIHLYPRWKDTEAKGPDLFAQRDTDPQPEWTSAEQTAIHKWAKRYQVHLINADCIL